MSLKTSWFTKSRRAQNVDDYETWIEGGVTPTMNAFDNGDVRATVLIVENNRRDGARLYEGITPTLQGFMGTGGGNVPLVSYPIDDSREIEKNQNGTGIGEEGAPAYTLDTRQHRAVATLEIGASIVRRLTPMECERLQGFPDGWTDGQADSHRYKQMGNAVAVPVVDWIVGNICAIV